MLGTLSTLCILLVKIIVPFLFYCIITVRERTQRNFDIAMMDGELWIRNGNMFMMGPGGSGKTCTLAAVLEEKPLST